MSRLAATVCVLTLLAACGDADPSSADDAPLEPDFASTEKADVADRVAMRGALDFAAPATGQFTEDLQFDAWTLGVRAGARVTLEVTHSGTSTKLDTTLFVYGPKGPGGYGTSALAKDADSGWGKNPRLRDLALPAAGEYLVVLGTHDGTGRGKYRLATTCASGDCAPPVVTLPEACPAHLADALLACTIGQTMDEGLEPRMRPTPEQGLATCLDAEGFAGPYDATCGAEPAPHCGLPYEEAWRALSELCRAALAPTIRRTTCTFGDSWRHLRHTPGIAVTGTRIARQVSQLSSKEREQVVAALKAAGHTDVRSATAALERADGHEINLAELWDESRGEAFLGVELGAGDTSVGAIFRKDSATPVVRNGDGDFYECTVPPGPRGARCQQTSDCTGGLTCQGLSEASGQGRCVAQDRREGAGNPCSLSEACGAGLLCAGLTRAPQSGLCVPAWMQNTFFPQPGVPLALPSGGAALELPIEVTGLATVDMDVWFHAVISPDTATGLTVRLVHASGTAVTLYEGRSDSLWLEQAVLGFSGDEYVNGTWTLVVTTTGGAGVVVEEPALTISSRWD